jgi:RNA polymerase sigma-70 factor (ECF subfamily)
MARFQEDLEGEAFDTLFSRFSGPALTVARSILPRRGLAEDAVQEAFMRVVRARDQFDTSREFAPWFYTILRNVCTDYLRSKQRSPEINGEEDTLRRCARDGGVPPDSPMLRLLHRLSDGQRAVLELRVFHDMRFRLIGEALGISEEAAKKRSQRGLRRLRELFYEAEENDKDENPSARTRQKSGKH